MGFLGFRPVLNPTIERSLRRLWRWFGTGFASFIDQAKRAVASKRYYGLPVRSLADGLEVHRTFGRRTGSPSYVWPTDWKSIVQRTIQPKGRHPRWCLAMDLVIGAIARQEANPTFDSCGCVDHCNHYLTRADCCILRLSGGLNFSPSISTLITTGGTPSTTMSKWQSEMSYNR